MSTLKPVKKAAEKKEHTLYELYFARLIDFELIKELVLMTYFQDSCTDFNAIYYRSSYPALSKVIFFCLFSFVSTNTVSIFLIHTKHCRCRSQWPRGLRGKSAAARLLRPWVWIPPGLWIFVCCECCVLSGIGLCDELITPPNESYRLWCVVVCDLETSRMRRPWPALGHSATAIK
jgi:hypothetical protein